MADVVAKLNEVLADEWACVRVLRRAEALSDEPGQLEVLKRVRKDCSLNCVTLANAIRVVGGRPTDIPSTRFTLKLTPESFADATDMVQSAQRHIIDGIGTLLDEPALKSVRSQLGQIQQLHKDDVRWLGSLLQ
ncbi:MAG: hypothetical protein PCFJNLEI_02864 [Verrucomicrobiae bacterium]|nr:hypothetical protein [Verrucomicrobiae bacterium]